MGIYAANTEDENEVALRRSVEELAAAFPEILQLHGFYHEPGLPRASFDIVVDFSADANEVCARLRERLLEKYPNMTFDIILDSDISD